MTKRTPPDHDDILRIAEDCECHAGHMCLRCYAEQCQEREEDLEDRVDELEAENTMLKAAAMAVGDQVRELEAKCAELEAETVIHMNTIKVAVDKATELESDLAALRERNVELEDEVAELGETSVGRANAYIQAENELKASRERERVLRDALKGVPKEVDAIMHDAYGADWGDHWGWLMEAMFRMEKAMEATQPAGKEQP